MKNSNITKNRTRVTLLLVLAASIIGLASAFSTSARAGSGSYSVNDVSGIYVDLGNGYFKHAGDTPFTIAGFVTFTPATGTFHFDELVRWDQVTYPYVFDGTYTVDVTGHGTMTWLDGIKHRDFYIVNGGAELKWMNTDPNGTGVATSGGTHDQTITKTNSGDQHGPTTECAHCVPCWLRVSPLTEGNPPLPGLRRSRRRQRRVFQFRSHPRRTTLPWQGCVLPSFTAGFLTRGNSESFREQAKETETLLAFHLCSLRSLLLKQNNWNFVFRFL